MSASVRLLLLLALLAPVLLTASAPFQLLNADFPGEGFNDATPVAPLATNPGVTLGQQRRNVFVRALQIWSENLNSTVPIRVVGYWDNLSCSENTATLGTAYSPVIINNFGAGVPNSWYVMSLANKLSGVDLVPPGNPFQLPEFDIVTVFNFDLGKQGCFEGSPFYLGLDTNSGNLPNLLTVVLHELSHGLGFYTTTNGQTGELFGGRPSIYDRFLFDVSKNRTWDQLNDVERSSSAINNAGLLRWNGPSVGASSRGVLDRAPAVRITAPAPATYPGGTSAFGVPLTTAVSGELMPLNPVAQGAGQACAPLSGFDAWAVNGKIAVIDRGICTFSIKVLNAQNAGAKGVIILNNVPGGLPPTIAGTSPAVVIPVTSMSQPDGAVLKNALRYRSRTSTGVFATLQIGTNYQGADSSGRVLIFTPAVYSPGSSISHWDPIASPSLLMEPSVTGDQSLFVGPPRDLTVPALRDMGW